MSRLRTAVNSLRTYVRSSVYPVVWANFGFVGRWLVRSAAEERPPVLILSMPRSGSSWVGKMVGNAQSGLYLREPINQSVLEHTELPTLFDVTSEDVVSKVRPFARDVFAGYPAFGRGIVKNPARWSWGRLSEGQVVVKEVNPLLYPWLQESFEFKTIYLIRHPVAVALSFRKLGWNAQENEWLSATNEVIAEEHSDGFWAYHGALQAVASKCVSDTLAKQDSHSYTIVKFEDLCSRPLEGYKELFSFAGLPWSQTEVDRIERHSTSTNARREDTYSTRRNSAQMIEAWREDVSEDQYQALKRAYLYYEPSFYREEW